MSLIDNTRTPEVQMATMVPALLGTYNFVVSSMTSEAAKVYRDGPEAAIANVAAMGPNANPIFQVSAIFEEAVNAAAPILGRPGIKVMPDGYAYTPNADGSGTLSYTPPSSSSSSSSSSSAFNGSSGSSSSSSGGQPEATKGK